MANSILTSHYSGTSNTILVSHGWPSGSSANPVLQSHDGDYPGGADTTPDAFTFTDQTAVAVSTTRTSNTITVAGINAAAAISITGGEYQIGAGSFTSTSGTVTNGQTVTVRHTSSASNSTATNTVLTIGGVSDTFTSTTVAASGFSAVLTASTGEMVISGSGFGTKPSPVAPVYFQPFIGITEGAVATSGAVGMDFSQHDTGGSATEPSVVNGAGYGGAGALVAVGHPIAAGTGDYKPHFGIWLSNENELFVNIWEKYAYTGGTPTSSQFKSIRAGRRDLTVSGGNDVEANYYYYPKFAGSIWIDSGGAGGDSSWLEYRNSSNTLFGNFELTHDSTVTPYSAVNWDKPGPYYPAPSTFNEWFNLETHFLNNTYGSANGLATLHLNGKEVIRVAGVQTKTVDAPEHSMQFVEFNPLWDGVAGVTTVTITYGRIYVDNTPYRVFLGNSATLENCAGRFMLPPTAWSDTAITVTHGLDIPSGYTYVYVMDSTGAVVSNGGAGFAYSTV